MKNARHEEILRIIREHAVETQDELAAYLIKSGFQATQATVSRDIRQLRLRKTTGPDGRQR
ncbi:MAG: arginine repressor, partial [Lachnospiraceae bacterium]|nr:arginine repressor [Lachnospiraceae bacterium]